jgi:hypothetical protein
MFKLNSLADGGGLGVIDMELLSVIRRAITHPLVSGLEL